MKKRIFAIVCAVLVLSALPLTAQAEKNTEDIVILYENDAHCVVEGYSKLAAMKKELQETYEYVGVVSGGDYIRGNSLGAASEGEYIIHLMNLVGYDAATLGNHEFGYRLPRLDELVGMMDTKPICCNFQKLGEDGSYYEPYSMVTYGDVKIAYIGITTPSTITLAFPMQFKDPSGEYLYTFHPEDLYRIVQENIDRAKADGADHVIALSHIGYGEDGEDVEDLIRNTHGLDVVLDAHSHSVIEEMRLEDKRGNEVLLSSAGSKFSHIGKLTVSRGEYKTELIETEQYTAADPAVDAYIQQIYGEFEALAGRKSAFSEVDLVTQDAQGNRLVRIAETNLGDLCAEAFRSAVGADIGYINGGGLRADLPAGDITYSSLLSVLPFSNTVVLAQVDGQTVKDMMEMAVMSWPNENGSFPHVAGITFSVNTAVESSVVLNEQEEFSGVSGQYRVYDIKVLNRESGKYEPLEPEGQYTVASHDYAILEQGDGMKMLANAEVLQNDGQLDAEALERYIVEDLGGLIEAAQYGEMTPNITFTEGEVYTKQPLSVLWIAGLAAVLVSAGVIVFLVKKSTRAKGKAA